MSNPDSTRHNFDRWLADGLKSPVSMDTAFADRVLNRLEQQTARRLLRRSVVHIRLLEGAACMLILSCIGAMLYPPVRSAIFSFLNTLPEGLVRLIIEPTLTGIALPAVVLALAGVVLWNLIAMVSLE